jgi:HAD superfamily hydrolase (TIGR01509 family)
LDQVFDNYYWSELVPREISKINNMPLVESKAQVAVMGKDLAGTLPWYEIEFWEKRFCIDLIKPARQNLSHIKFLPSAQESLKKLNALNKKIIFLTNCDARLLSVKSDAVPIMQYCTAFQSSTDLGIIKEDENYWPIVFDKFNIDPATSLFIDDNKQIVMAADRAGIKSSFHITEPTSDMSVIYKQEWKNSLRTIEDLF